jgi:tRNA(adenine34) deaminase
VQHADETYMALALDEARQAAAIGEVPIGAVVVCDGAVVASGYNRREIDHDPAGHAELLAIREAARRLERWRLSDCTVYVTLEPCPMCAGLMHQARVARCVYGAPDPKAGALGTLYDLSSDERLNHRFEVTSGILAEESAAMLREFFGRLREG